MRSEAKSRNQSDGTYRIISRTIECPQRQTLRSSFSSEVPQTHVEMTWLFTLYHSCSTAEIHITNSPAHLSIYTLPSSQHPFSPLPRQLAVEPPLCKLLLPPFLVSFRLLYFCLTSPRTLFLRNVLPLHLFGLPLQVTDCGLHRLLHCSPSSPLFLLLLSGLCFYSSPYVDCRFGRIRSARCRNRMHVHELAEPRLSKDIRL